MLLRTVPVLLVTILACGGGASSARHTGPVDDLDPVPFEAAASASAEHDLFAMERIADEPGAVFRPLTVIAPGAEPRAPLRRTVDVGHREAFDLTFDLSKNGMADPTAVQGTSIEVVARQGDTLAVRGVIDSHSIHDANARLTQADRQRVIDRYVGERWEALLTLAGAWLALVERTTASSQDTKVSPAGGADALMFVVPLPGEVPVGVGARWTVGSSRQDDDAVWHYDYVYTLVSRDGDRAVIDGEIKLTSRPRADGRYARLPSVITAKGRYRAIVEAGRLTSTNSGEMTREQTLGRDVNVMEMRWSVVARPLPAASAR